MRTRNKPAHVRRGNALDDLGFSPEQATALKFKADLYQAILKYARQYSQKELQIILGEPQPRVSELLNGKIANKSVDKLLQYAGRLGIEAKSRFPQTNKDVIRKKLAMAARSWVLDPFGSAETNGSLPAVPNFQSVILTRTLA